MVERTPFEENMLRHDFRMAWLQLSTLDMKCFYLEGRLRRLERNWPGSTPEEQRRLRLERMRVRYEFELLKIDLRNLERRAEPLFKTLSRARVQHAIPPSVCYNQMLKFIDERD